jgi:predicted dehydrogenase
MGKRHARVLSGLPERYHLAATYDLDGGNVPGVRTCSSEAEAIALSEVVVVATPIEAHFATVARALASGRHVLVEKPLCSSTDEARALARGGRGGARLFVGQSERFNPVVRALARLVRNDPALSIDLTRVGPARPCGAGVLLNLGVHDFDLAGYLGGGPVSVQALRIAPSPQAASRDEVAHVLFRVPGGATGSILVDRTAPARRRTLRLVTARWVYEGDLLSHRLVRRARSGGAPSEVPLAREEPLAAQAASLADALDPAADWGAREIATGADGARAVALAEHSARAASAGSGSDACGEEAEKLSVLGSP